MKKDCTVSPSMHNKMEILGKKKLEVDNESIL